MTTKTRKQPTCTESSSKVKIHWNRSKKLLAFWLCLFFVGLGYGQNLVPNPSFEEYNACPDTVNLPPTGSNISASTGWFNAGGFTPDYFNPCDTSVVFPNYGTPINQYGNQSARTGVAYAGVITSWLPNNPNTREYISIKLNDTLESSEKYLITYYVSLSELSYYATNHIGVYFSSDSIYSSSFENLPFIPQSENDYISNELLDTTQWMKIEDTIIANGGERFLTLGNFRNDSNTDTSNFDANSNAFDISYYYIDDISLIKLASNGIHLNDSPVKMSVHPNPFSDEILVELDNSEKYNISLFNIYGAVIFETQAEGSSAINTTSLQEGIYILKIEQEGKILSTLKLNKK